MLWSIFCRYHRKVSGTVVVTTCAISIISQQKILQKMRHVRNNFRGWVFLHMNRVLKPTSIAYIPSVWGWRNDREIGIGECLGDKSRQKSLRWRHNDHAGVSNHQPHGCLLNRLFRRKSKKTSKLRVTGLCAGNSPGTGEFPAQMASYAENVSIWWRHHVLFRQHFTALDWRQGDVIDLLSVSLK